MRTPLRILATSRQRLGVPGEVIRVVSPLEVPAAGTPASELEQSPAARLLLHAMARNRPIDSLDEALAGDVTDVCRLVDGLPLAIELVAAWTRVLSLRQLAGELRGRADILGTSPDGRDRSALTIAIDATWSQLTAHEQRVLAPSP